MDYAACNVVYVDRTAGEDRLVQRADLSLQLDGHAGSRHEQSKDGVSGASTMSSRVKQDLATLLDIFTEVHVCSSGKSCVQKLGELHETSAVDLIPTIVLIDVPYHDPTWEDQRSARTPSPTSNRNLEGEPTAADEAEERFYGLSLLQWVVSDIQQNNLTKLVVPVAVVAIPPGSGQWPLTAPKSSEYTVLDQRRTMRYLDVGAVDVLTAPLIPGRLPSLAIHAYRAHKESMREHKAIVDLKRGRKRSWVGLDDQKPYAYLREAMVSGLMDGICRTGGEEESIPTHARISIPDERKAKIEVAIGSWYFSAHDFSDDELLQAASLMLQHALSMSELEQWRIPTDNLTGFLVACRAAYNSFVPYHNFRHVIDVLQACFHFLVRIGTLPPYPVGSSAPIEESAKSPLVTLLRPFDALTLLITAIGHDVGHPGVNNAFLVTLNAPLAQLYNDRSVLESFHCAAYSQILRRHWPSAFAGVEMRQLMISSILATDMGLHFDYMKKLGFLEERIHENKGTDGFNGRLREEYRTLACSLLIKCADISNVARRYDVAARWTMILTDEFARQASMERDLAIPSALFAPPVREIVELGQSQIGFMNMFAIPLFQGVTDVMPAMKFCVDELQRNRKIWEDRIDIEQSKKRKDSDDSINKDGSFSPRHTDKVGGGSPVSGPATPSASSPNVASYSGNGKHHSKSPLSTSDSTFSNFKSLVDLPSSEDDARRGLLDSESLIPPQYSLGRDVSHAKVGGLEVSYATASAPGLLDPANKDRPKRIDNTSLVTDAVVPEPEVNQSNADLRRAEESKQLLGSTKTSTEASRNRPRSEWTGSGSGSQATSATTGKLPLSPSTKGTSITSYDNDEEIDPLSTGPISKGGKPEAASAPSFTTGSSSARVSRSAPSEGGSKSWQNLPNDAIMTGDRGRFPVKRNENEKSGGLMGTMKGLTKKPSRSRFRFWKKKGSFNSDKSIEKAISKDRDDAPPVPTTNKGEQGR